MCNVIEPQAPAAGHGRRPAFAVLPIDSRRYVKDVIFLADNTIKNRRISLRAGALGMSHIYLREMLLCLLLSLPWANPAFAQHEHSSGDFEVFVAAEAFHGTRQTRLGDADPWIDADVVFGATQHQFRVFGEYYITPDERDLERLQMGFEFVPETVLWLGRFHQPGSFFRVAPAAGQGGGNPDVRRSRRRACLVGSRVGSHRSDRAQSRQAPAI